MFEKIIALIEKYDKIIIHRHQKPDGDALGSQLGLLGIIRDSYPEKQVYAVGDMTPRYAFMAEREMDEIDDSVYEGALAIILDTSAKELISDSRYTMAEATARLDHHLFVEKIADEEVTDSSFESCCGLVTAFAKECGLTVSPVAAKLLYTGMITDSGRFRYDSTNAQTHTMAAFLMERGFDTADIFRNLYSDDLTFIQLRAKFVLKIQTTPHRVAFIYTDRAEADEMARQMDRIALAQVIEQLPPTWKKIILLRYYRDMTQQQVADLMGLTQVKVSREEKKIMAFMRERLS